MTADLPLDDDPAASGAAENGRRYGQEPWQRARAFAEARPGALLALGAFVCLVAAYATIFRLTGDGPLFDDLLDSLVNAGSAALWGGGAVLILHWAIGRIGPAGLAALHFGLAVAFGVLWYLSVLVLLSLQDGSVATGFSVRPFSPVAFYWQVFQGIVLYAAIAFAVHAVHLGKRLRGLQAELTRLRAAAPGPVPAADPPAQATPPADTVLVKRDDEIVALSRAEIVRLSGAGDYTEVAARSGCYLSATTLAAFEETLGPGFVRVHRSHIVNLDALERAEPAGGGRLTLHLKDGSSVTTSRAGARPIRDRAR